MSDHPHNIFLSTLSLRRATRYFTCFIGRLLISIHALLAESDILLLRSADCNYHFYPRSPCGERPPSHSLYRRNRKFLSTLSLRRATFPINVMSVSAVQISIHALLAESDDGSKSSIEEVSISIHALLAESDGKPRALKSLRCVFLSTLSLRRATAKVHKTVGHFCAYETNFMGIASSC